MYISSCCLRIGPLTELWIRSNLHWTHYTTNEALAIFSHFMVVWPTNQVFIQFYILKNMTLKEAIKKKQSSLITYLLLILALLIPQTVCKSEYFTLHFNDWYVFSPRLSNLRQK